MYSTTASLTHALGVYFVMVWVCATGLAALLAGLAALWRSRVGRFAADAASSRATAPHAAQP